MKYERKRKKEMQQSSRNPTPEQTIEETKKEKETAERYLLYAHQTKTDNKRRETVLLQKGDSRKAFMKIDQQAHKPPLNPKP